MLKLFFWSGLHVRVARVCKTLVPDAFFNGTVRHPPGRLLRCDVRPNEPAGGAACSDLKTTPPCAPRRSVERDEGPRRHWAHGGRPVPRWVEACLPLLFVHIASGGRRADHGPAPPARPYWQIRIKANLRRR